MIKNLLVLGLLVGKWLRKRQWKSTKLKYAPGYSATMGSPQFMAAYGLWRKIEIQHDSEFMFTEFPGDAIAGFVFAFRSQRFS